MTYSGTDCMDLEDYVLQQRLAEYLRAQYPAEREKRLARDIGCEVRTAKNILNRHWPSARHLRAIVQRFGRDVLEVVFTVDIDPVDARLAKEERELEEQLARTRARRRQITGGRAGGSGRVAPTAPRLRSVDRRN